jgi:pilus assembly protein Flp/PilA
MRRLARSIAGWFSFTSERGVTAIEYGLIAALIAVVIVGGLTLIGTNLSSVFNSIATSIKAAT